MIARKRRRLPPGRPPSDPWNGARVGVLAGAIVGVGATVLLGLTSLWLALIVAAVGGAVGFLSEKRKQRLDTGPSDSRGSSDENDR